MDDTNSEVKKSSKAGSYRSILHRNQESDNSSKSSSNLRPKSMKNVYEHGQVASVIRRSDFDERNIFGGQKNRPRSWHPPNKKERRLFKQFIVEQSDAENIDKVQLDIMSSITQQTKTTQSRSVKSYVINESSSSSTNNAWIGEASINSTVVCENMKYNEAHRSAINISTTKDNAFRTEHNPLDRYFDKNASSSHSQHDSRLKSSLPERSLSEENSEDNNRKRFTNIFKKPRQSITSEESDHFSISESNPSAPGFLNSFEAMKRTSLMMSFKKSPKEINDKDKQEQKSEEKSPLRRQGSVLRDGLNSMRNFFMGRHSKPEEVDQNKPKEKIGNQRVFVVSDADSVDSGKPNSNLKQKRATGNDTSSTQIQEESAPEYEENMTTHSSNPFNNNNNNNNGFHSIGNLSNNMNESTSSNESQNKRDIIESIAESKQKMREMKERFLNDQCVEPCSPTNMDTTWRGNANRLSDASSRSSIDSINSKILTTPTISTPPITPVLTNNSYSSVGGTATTVSKEDNHLLTTATQIDTRLDNSSESKTAVTNSMTEKSLFDKNEKTRFNLTPHFPVKVNKPFNQYKRMSLPSPIIESQESVTDYSGGNEQTTATVFKVPLPVDQRRFDNQKLTNNHLNEESENSLSDIEMLSTAKVLNGNHPVRLNEEEEDVKYFIINWSGALRFCYSKLHSLDQIRLDKEIVQSIMNLNDELFHYCAIPAQRRILNHIAQVMEASNPYAGIKIDQYKKDDVKHSSTKASRQNLISLISQKIDLLYKENNEMKKIHQINQNDLIQIRDDLAIKCSNSCVVKFDRFVSSINTILKLMCLLSRRLSNLEILSNKRADDEYDYKSIKKKLHEQIIDAKKIFSNIKVNQSQILPSIADCTSLHYVQIIKEKIETAVKISMHLEILEADLKDYIELKERLISINEI